MSARDIGVLEDKFDEFNADRTGFHDAARLAFTLTVHDELVGGVAGFTWAGFCELRQLWVDEGFRGLGYGTALLTEAIEEARARCPGLLRSCSSRL